jgi:ElaB/YqjD/DUF883 family membrane-anchored ribosome-binding protein
MDRSATHPDPSSQPTADEFKQSAVKAAEDLREAAGERARNLRANAEKHASEFKGFADHTWDDAKQVAIELKAEGEQFVRENPARAVLTAVGIGFVVGLIFRR